MRDVAELSEKVGYAIAQEVERRCQEFVSAAMGVDWTATLGKALKEIVALREERKTTRLRLARTLWALRKVHRLWCIRPQCACYVCEALKEDRRGKGNA